MHRESASAGAAQSTRTRRRATGAGVGASPPRPDGGLKVTGKFAYSSDLYLDNMLWGATVRSPHPRARVIGIDVSEALTLGGVATVLTSEDVPGNKLYGMKVADQPVLAFGEVRYQGEPVAIVAADHPETARRAAEAISVEFEILTPLTDPELALDDASEPIHPGGNVARHVRIRHGNVETARGEAAVIVEGEYETGTQDPAFLGPESGLAVPDGSGGVELFVASQWIHDDQRQIAESLGLSEDQVRVVLAGVGGAFGGREDLSIHIHACLLALRTGRPVKMSYNREESFVGHVHRHPARMFVEQGATREGRLVFTKARLVFDGGAYTSTSKIVIANGSYFAAGAYQVDNVEIDGFAVYTNNPPRGAMRGFGAVQSCYAIESSMDRLAKALDMDPLELRRRNAISEGTVLPTGQAIDGPAPVAELLDYLADLPMPDGPAPELDLRLLPGGVGNTTHGEGIKRGVGYALGMKAIGFSGGVDDYSTAQVTVSVAGGVPLAEVYTAAAECGQGIVGVQAQIARTELGIDNVVVLPADTDIGDAGSSSASRQTWMSGGAVKGACDELRATILDRGAAALHRDRTDLALEDGALVDRADGTRSLSLADLLGGDSISATFEYRHRPTEGIDDELGQGDAHVAFAYAAHRAVVDVDVELGLVRVVELATAQDVGKAMNPQAVEGQIEGGSAQGLGLAILEEVQIADGIVQNPSFTDYLIPTILDMPPMRNKIFEFPHPDSPYGLNGVGEPPTLSSTPAIANALRNATGLDLPRVPVRPTDLISTMSEEAT
ncbi:MAG: xanthine dehydrogenase subunit D [Acidimicrobiia bacterium]|nr:xanthine dehydrogenase subunit D [Acidimicrobiia bacterium]